MLVLIPILFRGSKVVIFLFFFNQYQVGPMALLNNMNSVNSLLQAAWYWDFFFFFFFCLLCTGAKMVFQVILVKKFESLGGTWPPRPPSLRPYLGHWLIIHFRKDLTSILWEIKKAVKTSITFFFSFSIKTFLK